MSKIEKQLEICPPAYMCKGPNRENFVSTGHKCGYCKGNGWFWGTDKEVGKPSGIYKILERPFYYGDCVTGFDAFFDGAIQKVSDIDIEEVYSILHPRINKENITLDCMCPHCAEKYLRKDNFIRADSLYCILQEKQRNQMFADYSDERIHRLRQDMIHRRITFRGLLQLHNK